MNRDSLESIEVFYCYAPEDQALRVELEKYLVALKFDHSIRDWDIPIGAGWMQAVNVHFGTANIILLLISSSFIDLYYRYIVEMRRALECHKQGEAWVIPIILRPVYWEGTPIASLSALPTGGEPIMSWSNRDAAFTDVSKGIRKVIQEVIPASTNDKMLEKTDQESYSHYETIDTSEVIALFKRIMDNDGHIRVLRLIGEAKMGKSHLLAKVFPSIVEQDDQARHVILDMRNRMYAVPDILGMACDFLGLEHFDFYSAASSEWKSRPQRETQRSQSNQGTEQNISRYTQARDRDLTLKFVRDLSKLDDKLLLFLLDSVNNANKYVQSWLSNTFLPYVSQTVHVRTVVAGRSLPSVHSSYALCCEDYQLEAIKNVEDYVNYCRGLNAQLEEQSIRDFAYACDYVPGMFVELVYPKFIKEKNIS